MHRVLTFYKFQPVASLEEMRDTLKSEGRQLNLKGTVLLAQEGANGTVTGEKAALKQFEQHLLQHFAEMPFKWSELDPQNAGFYRFKVRIKAEIVSFGIPDLDVAQTGEHVSSERWNKLLDDPNVLVIDTRNDYEIKIGTFPGSISPETRNFRQFPNWVANNLDPNKQPQIAMCCTGGIRCEKASAYLRSAGFKHVYQLGGGILKYLETVESGASRWDGECFVFDQRVSVNTNLSKAATNSVFPVAFRSPARISSHLNTSQALAVLTATLASSAPMPSVAKDFVNATDKCNSPKNEAHSTSASRKKDDGEKKSFGKSVSR